jgi:hypothetical protein
MAWRVTSTFACFSIICFLLVAKNGKEAAHYQHQLSRTNEPGVEQTRSGGLQRKFAEPR